MENLPQQQGEENYEKDPKEVFEKYVKDLSLKEEDLLKPLLEVGANDGSFVHYLRTALGNKDAQGIEKNASRINPKMEGTIEADGLELPFANESFDIVIARDYLPMFVGRGLENKVALDELLRVVKRKGKVIANIMTPEKELANQEEFKRSDVRFKERYDGAKDFEAFLEALKGTGYLIDSKTSSKGRTVISIEKS